MKTIKWDKPLSFRKRPRRSFNSWEIPQAIRQQHGIENGDYVDVTFRFGRQTRTKQFRVTSGGELNVNRVTAKQIETYAQANPGKYVSFEMRVVSTLLNDLETAKKDKKIKQETERQAIIAARIGQGKFGEELFRKYKGRCAVTGVSVGALLRASHIKPWRESINKERLDVENGLLLVANLDAAFDKHLISFNDQGRMLFHENLGSNPHSTLGVRKNSRLIKSPSTAQRKYLALHRSASEINQ